MVLIPTATWRGVCPKWILMFWCCVVLFAGRTQSFPVGGDSVNERRSLLFFWRRSPSPSPSQSPPKSQDLSSTLHTYAQPRTSPPSVGKKVPVLETQKEDTEPATDFASSKHRALNPTIWDVIARGVSPKKSTSPSGGKGSKSPSSSGSTTSEEDAGNLSYLEQLDKITHPSPPPPSPPEKNTTSPSPSSPPSQRHKLTPVAAVLQSASDRGKSPSPTPGPPSQDTNVTLTAFIKTMSPSPVAPSASPSPMTSPSIQPKPSVPTTPPSKSPTVAPEKSPAVTPAPVPSEGPAEASIETPTTVPEEGPTTSPSEGPVVAPSKSPAPVPSESPAETSIETPTSVPEESPTTPSSESPDVATSESPGPVAIESPEVTLVGTPTVVRSKSPEVASIESPTTPSSESPEVGSSKSPEASFSESFVIAPIEVPEASFSEILEAVSSKITEISPIAIPEAASSEIAEPFILEIPATTIPSTAEPSFVEALPSEYLIQKSVPLESPDASFTSPQSMKAEESIASIVPFLLPPVEASESSPDSSSIAASSEAPQSSLRVDVPIGTSPDTSMPAETPSAEPDVPPIASIEAPLPSTPPEGPTEITLDEIKALNPGVEFEVSTDEGKVGVLVPKGKSMKLENVVFEVADDVDVAIATEGGLIEFDRVIIRFKPQSTPSFHRMLRTTLPKTQKGLVLTNGASTKISNSTFEGSTDSMIDMKSGSQFHCFGCVFKDNMGQQGGAIRAEGSNVWLESCSFENNEASSGGALYILGQHFGDKTTTLTITDSTFNVNKATKEGGTIYVKNVDTCLMKNSKVNKGVAGTQGGGLFVSSTNKVQITGSEFDNNKAEASYGGAASLYFCSEIDVSESQFRSNDANDGGALAVFEKYKASGKLEISKSIFQSNEALNRGGAILIQTKNQGEIETSTDAYTTINNSSFLYNTAIDGGAIYAFSNSGESFTLTMGITSTQFVGNQATKSGGGLYCGRHSIIHFGNSDFQSNEAQTGKGCATYCGCSVSTDQTDSLLLQQITEEGGSQSECTTGTASIAGAREPGTSNNKSNTLLYVFITLAVMAALVLVSIAVVLKHKRAMQSNGTNLLRRSLSSYTGPSRLHHIISVPFSDPPESQEDANSTTTALLRRTHDYGEMEHQFDAAVNIEESEVGSVQSHFITDEEERMAETIFADDAFAIDAFGDDSSAPLLPTVSNLHQMTDDNRQ